MTVRRSSGPRIRTPRLSQSGDRLCSVGVGRNHDSVESSPSLHVTEEENPPIKPTVLQPLQYLTLLDTFHAFRALVAWNHSMVCYRYLVGLVFPLPISASHRLD